MRNIFRYITAIAALGLVSVISAEILTKDSGKAWAGPSTEGQHRSILRIAESEHFPIRKKVRIGLGKSMMIELPREIRDVVVSNPEIVDAVVQTSTRAYLIGKQKTGQSSAFFFDADGEQLLTLEITVERDVTVLSDLLNRLIRHANINVEILNETIILTGRVRNPGDASRASDIASRFIVHAKGEPNERHREKVVNLLSVEANEQILLKVTIAEMQRDTIKRIGVNWSNVNVGNSGFIGGTQNKFPLTDQFGSNSFLTGTFGPSGNRADCFPGGGTGIPGTVGGALVTNALPLAAVNCLTKTVEALERNGLLRTLAEPSLTAISGETASFLAGGEFPVPVSNDRGNITVEFKPFGVGLSFTPMVLSEGRISLRISTEVSELDPIASVTAGTFTIPGLKVRRTNTTVELPSGGSLVIAGLISDDTRQNIDGVPGLKKLPILGSLFRSRDFKKKETELVIIVTPLTVKPVARRHLAQPDDGFMPASDPKGIFLGQLNRVYGRRDDLPTGSYKGNYGFIID